MGFTIIRKGKKEALPVDIVPESSGDDRRVQTKTRMARPLEPDHEAPYPDMVWGQYGLEFIRGSDGKTTVGKRPLMGWIPGQQKAKFK